MADGLFMADQWSQLGYVLLAQGDDGGAERAFRQAVRAGSAQGWTGLGDLLTARGEHLEAAAMYRRAENAGDPGKVPVARA